MVNSPTYAGDLSSVPGTEDPLEKEMAVHASILAWSNSWTEKPSGLQSICSKESGTTEQLHTNVRYLNLHM